MSSPHFGSAPLIVRGAVSHHLLEGFFEMITASEKRRYMECREGGMPPFSAAWHCQLMASNVVAVLVIEDKMPVDQLTDVQERFEFWRFATRFLQPKY